MKKRGINVALATLLLATNGFADEQKEIKSQIKYDERLGITVATDKGYTERKEKEGTVKFDGQLRLWYQTMDHAGPLANGQKDKGLFARDADMANEWGNVEVQFSVTGEINEHLKAKGSFMAVSTMGMESQITSFQTARTGSTGALDGRSAQPFWVHEAYLDYVFTKNTDLKLGRMELDTPLIYTEKWNATANAFEAMSATNTDLPKTTLTLAWIAKGNGAQTKLKAAPQVFGAESTFNEFMGYDDVNASSGGGAVVVGAVNKSLDFMPIQAWGYSMPNAAVGYWVQADPSAKNVGPLSSASLSLIAGGLGAQGATETFLKTNNFANSNGSTHNDAQMTHALAAKVGVSASIFNAYAAFSSITKGNLPVANIGTNYKKTKLPTASIFNDGMVVAQPDTTTWKVGAGAKFEGIGTLSVSYGSSTVGQNAGFQNPTANVSGPASMGYIAQNFRGEAIDVTEFDIIFNTKVKDVDIAAMYIRVNNTYVPVLDGNGAPATGAGFTNYGGYANDIVRIVATLKF